MRHGTKYSYIEKRCRCQVCLDAADSIKDKRKTARNRKLPVQPMLENLPNQFIIDHSSRIEMWKRVGGITVREADKYCCKYGVHPFLVYGSLWIDDYWAKV